MGKIETNIWAEELAKKPLTEDERKVLEELSDAFESGVEVGKKQGREEAFQKVINKARSQKKPLPSMFAAKGNYIYLEEVEALAKESP